LGFGRGNERNPGVPCHQYLPTIIGNCHITVRWPSRAHPGTRDQRVY
jgi:hypothetical protein